MTAVTVSPKFQVVIPKQLREQLRLKPGQKLYMFVADGSLRLELPSPIDAIRGIAKGMKWKEEYRDRGEGA